jgi:nucleoside-triphosphatase
MAIEPTATDDWQKRVARRATALLLTGRPGVGKTTVVRQVAEQLGRRPGGFYTDEVREGGASKGDRRGFRAVTFAGETWPIADVDRRKPPRVGRYGVDVAAIDRLATLLRPDREVAVYIIDEVGKMECLSSRFVEATRELLDSGLLVVATVGQKGAGFIADIKRRPDVELWEVTRQNRDDVPARVLGWVEQRLR